MDWHYRFQVSAIVSFLLGPERAEKMQIFAGDVVPKKKPDPVNSHSPICIFDLIIDTIKQRAPPFLPHSHASTRFLMFSCWIIVLDVFFFAGNLYTSIHNPRRWPCKVTEWNLHDTCTTAIARKKVMMLSYRSEKWLMWNYESFFFYFTYWLLGWSSSQNYSKSIFFFDVHSCVVVEDSAIGLAAAKAAGMKCIVTKSG